MNYQLKLPVYLLIPTLFFYCSSRQVSLFQNSTGTINGWIDEDTYRIAARGKSLNKGDINHKIDSAENEAIENAQRELLKNFNLLKVNYTDTNNNPTNVALCKELKIIISSGKVIDKNYNVDSKICEIIYEVKSIGLKQKVEAVQ